jgi:DNA polymerase-1
MIAFDTETRNLRSWEGSAFLATWADADHEHAETLESAMVSPFRIALGDNETLIAHNAKFDAAQLRTTIGYDVFEHGHTLHDTALMSRIVYGRQLPNHRLETLSEKFLPDGGKAKTKASITEIYQSLTGRSSMAHDDAYYDVWSANPEALEDYAMADVRDTYDLFHVMWPLLEEDPKLMQVYKLELALQRVIYDAEKRGVRIDPAAVDRLQTQHAKAELHAAAELEMELDVEPALLEGEGSTERLRDALLAAGTPLTELTDEGHLAVNRKALAAHAQRPEVKALFDWRRARKFQQTYLEPLVGREVVHPDYMQAEAWTGRMSCRRPNLTNLPKRNDEGATNDRIRSVFVPREGHSFVVCDFDSVEPRILAFYLGDEGYRKVVAEGRTYELACQAAWGGVPEDYAKGGPKEELRNVGKMIYLAIAYGAGGRAVRDQINAMAPPEYHVDLDWSKDPDNPYDTPPQAQALKKRIVASIPGFDALASSNRRNPGRIMKQLQDQGYVRTIYGRKQFVPKDRMYVGLNALIQGSAADVFKLAAVEVAKVTADLGAQQLLFVHDELVLEVPSEHAEECLRRTQNAMRGAIELDPPLEVDGSITEVSYAHA